jgi:hypothetical protein
MESLMFISEAFLHIITGIDKGTRTIFHSRLASDG